MTSMRISCECQHSQSLSLSIATMTVTVMIAVEKTVDKLLVVPQNGRAS
jgi:hypothetical protein